MLPNLQHLSSQTLDLPHSLSEPIGNLSHGHHGRIEISVVDETEVFDSFFDDVLLFAEAGVGGVVLVELVKVGFVVCDGRDYYRICVVVVSIVVSIVVGRIIVTDTDIIGIGFEELGA